MHVRGSVINRRQDEDGASLVEYGLMLALIAVVAFSAVFMFGANGDGLLTESCEKLGQAMTGEACE